MGADRPIFVLGCPRSGTTLLQLMLHAHPRIAMPPETRFVLTSYEARNSFGDLREEPNRRALADSIVRERHTLFYDLGLDADEVFEKIVEGPPTLGSAIGIVFRGYARRFDKPRWGDKRPGYYQYIPALLRMFPDAQIVHLIRDGRDCVASLLTMPWFKQDIYAAICSWTEAIDSGRPAARAETQNEIIKAPSGHWSQRLEPWQIALCEMAMGSRLRSLGYELSGAGRPPAGHHARYLRAASLHRGAAYKRRLRDRVQRLREPGPVASQL